MHEHSLPSKTMVLAPETIRGAHHYADESQRQDAIERWYQQQGICSVCRGTGQPSLGAQGMGLLECWSCLGTGQSTVPSDS